MNPLLRLWYHVTAYVPRRLPRTPEEYQRFREILVDAYGVRNDAQIWYGVAGQVAATPAHRLRKPWGHIANAAKRVHINALASEQRGIAQLELQERMQTIAKQMKEAQDAEEAAEKLASPNAGPPQTQAEGPPEVQAASANDLPRAPEAERVHGREEG